MTDDTKKRCAAQVWDSCSGRRKACQRFAAVGDYCRQHDPVAVAAKRAREVAKWKLASELSAARVVLEIAQRNLLLAVCDCDAPLPFAIAAARAAFRKATGEHENARSNLNEHEATR